MTFYKTNIKQMKYMIFLLTKTIQIFFLRNIPTNPRVPAMPVTGNKVMDVTTSPLTVDPSLRFPIYSLLRILIKLSSITSAQSFQTRPITKYPTDTHFQTQTNKYRKKIINLYQCLHLQSLNCNQVRTYFFFFLD